MAASQPQFFDSLARGKRPLEPLAAPEVRIYSCGPTVYDVPHIGNYRFFVWVDVLHRYLLARGYAPRLVMNITDVDDRTIAGARAAGVDLDTFTKPFAEAFLEGLNRLGAIPAERYPRATRHIEAMVDLVETLIARGHAYEAKGNVFFSVASFPRYGRLADLDPDAMRATSRVEGDDLGKKDPRDFTLWKAARDDEPAWPARFGDGRPGWHLECSAMSMQYLGETFDLHLGGSDLKFPHHENELAQSEAATGKPFARMWMHCSHLVVDGTKMSKSLGNFHTLQALLESGHDPIAIRYLLASVHYRRQLNFTFEALDQSASAIGRIRELLVRCNEATASLPDRSEAATGLAQSLRTARAAHDAALDDDLNTAAALGHLFTLVRDTNTALDQDRADAATVGEIAGWLHESDRVWGVLGATTRREIEVAHGDATLRASGPPVDEALEELIVRRMRARADRDFAAADALRDELVEAGIELEDTPAGVRWRAAGRKAPG